MYLIYIKPIYKQIKGNISFEQYGDDHVIIILPFKVTIVQTFANEHIVFLWYMQTLSLVVVFFKDISTLFMKICKIKLNMEWFRPLSS